MDSRCTCRRSYPRRRTRNDGMIGRPNGERRGSWTGATIRGVASDRTWAALRVVAVFGGGGAKAAAHIGAQRALVEAGLAPCHFVGTSFGAVIGAAFAAGATPDSLRAGLTSGDKVAAIDLLSLVKGVYADHLLKAEPLRALIARLVPVNKFGDVKLPISIVSTDLESGDLVVFGAGGRSDVAVWDALYATCALPLYFVPA